MTDDEVDDWIRYAEVENFGGPADDFRTAVIAHAVAAFSDRGTKAPAADFLPVWSSDPTPPPTGAELAAKFRALTANLS